ncbi:HlyD family efflux transporter periplasmic adaptor subunit [Microseira wollei]|uniref:Secretion protein HlyD n=1 Tax=Microseira wollei NIES-4236 TaxID=2530354 RepID=A0AAV3WJL4_9CYAN|nr:HlyD family efflux transporter periplasmic adaptor subunit [Microseira wollei]GET40359.1 secretion protein HlyD [Microseira wollei NIES-4236]
MINDKFDIDPLNPLDSDDFLPPMGRWMRLSGIFLMGTFGAAIALSGFIKYNTVVKASGMVRPQTELQTVQAQSEGRLTAIKVKENQQVQAESEIAQIDDTPHKRKRSQVQQYIDRLRTQQQQLKNQIYGSTSGNRQNPPRGLDINELNFPNLAPQIRQYKQLQNNIDSAHKEVEQLDEAIENSTIRTPVAGTIFGLDVENVGQPVRNGARIAQIIPKNVPMVIKANVPVDALGQVEVGQSVQLRVSAYPYPDYGTLKGKVSEIAPDAVTAQNQNNNNNDEGSFPAAAAYYEVTIVPEKSYLTRSNKQYNIQPGMGVTADIISREETVLTFLLRKARLMTDL